jgi:hypothetical protein
MLEQTFLFLSVQTSCIAMGKSSSSKARQGSKKPTCNAKPKSKAKAKAAAATPKPATLAQGLIAVAGMTTESPFDVRSFGEEVKTLLSCQPAGRGPVRVGTACSGAGTPTIVLKLLHPATEIFSSEINPCAAHALWLNADPTHIHTDVHMQARKPFVWCYKCNQTCAAPAATSALDLFIAGFPCNRNSQMNAQRFQQDPTCTPDARVFQSTCDVVAKCKPKVFILENVNGVLMKRSQEEDSDTVADWILKEIRQRVGSDYVVQHLTLGSLVLREPQFFFFQTLIRRDVSY